ncbi:MAG: DUF2652 domain-containing protein [Anaerolineae bacterium]|nr:DUF2652 domain-containing protein [Anaerolineae bacterium]
MINKGYFVIADITGYTAFLTGSELDHAQDILKSLFDTILDQITPPLIVSNYQGDAILTYAPEAAVLQGQTLLELIENIYFAFSHKRENIRHATTCQCRACANISNLDLKLFAHYGEYVLQDMRGKQELGGTDVIVTHRMMKNQVKEQTGIKAYALFTDTAIKQLGLQGMCVQLQAHSESYEHIGEVQMWVHDLKAAYDHERERNPVVVKPEDAWVTIEHDFRLPPAIMWDYLNKPENRRRYMNAVGMTITNVDKGRVGVGAVNHCAHGGGAETLMTILDWRPFDYVTLDTSLPMHMRGIFTTYLQAIPGGTRVIWALGKPEGADFRGKAISRFVMPKFRTEYAKVFAMGADTIEAIIAEEGVGKVIAFAPAPN